MMKRNTDNNFFNIIFVIVVLCLPVLLSEISFFPDSVKNGLTLFALCGLILCFLWLNRPVYWLPIFLTYSLSGSFDLSISIPGVNPLNICFGLACFSFIINGWWRELKKDSSRNAIIFILILYFMLRVVAIFRTDPSCLLPVVSALLRNFIILIISYVALNCEIEKNPDKPPRDLVLFLMLLISFILIVFICAIPWDAYKLATAGYKYSQFRNELGRGANGIGFLAGISFVYLLFLCLAVKSKFLKVFLMTGAAVAIFDVLLSFSRTGLIAICLSIVIMLLISGKFNRLAFFVAIGIYTVYFIIPDKYFIRFYEMVEHPEIIYGGDLSRWEVNFYPLFRAMKENPLFGLGFRGYMIEYGGDSIFRTHNAYSEELTETGILGAVALAWLIWKIYKQMNVQRKCGAKGLSIENISLVVFLFWIIFATQGSLSIESSSGGLIFILLGVMLSYNHALMAQSFSGNEDKPADVELK